MIIDSNLPAINPSKFELSGKKGKPAVAETKVATEHLYGKPDLKEVADQAVQDAPRMGEFKDKKGLEQATDLHIGPDIRYALTSRNVNFLKRILWGPLTVGEYREVQYRIRELQSSFSSDTNLLKGQLFDIT